MSNNTSSNIVSSIEHFLSDYPPIPYKKLFRGNTTLSSGEIYFRIWEELEDLGLTNAHKKSLVDEAFPEIYHKMYTDAITYLENTGNHIPAATLLNPFTSYLDHQYRDWAIHNFSPRAQAITGIPVVPNSKVQHLEDNTPKPKEPTAELVQPEPYADVDAEPFNESLMFNQFAQRINQFPISQNPAEAEERERHQMGEEDRASMRGLGLHRSSNNPWIAHIKHVQNIHRCSYKEAMKIASHTYKK